MQEINYTTRLNSLLKKECMENRPGAIRYENKIKSREKIKCSTELNGKMVILRSSPEIKSYKMNLSTNKTV